MNVVNINVAQRLVLLVIFFEMVFWQKVNKEFKNKYFIIKKITDTLRLILIYFWCIFYVIYYEPVVKGIGFKWSNILWILIPSIGLLLLYTIGLKIILVNNPQKAELKKSLSIIISMLIAIIIYFAGINFCVYYINTESYSVLICQKWYEFAFEFLYYSFTVSVTYASGTIEPVSIISKLLAMLQIVIFYYAIGEGVMEIINRNKNTVNN